MIDPKLIEILRCPIDGGGLKLAENPLISQVNEAIARGEIRDRQEQQVADPIEGGLVNELGKWLYPIRGGIPTLVADEAINLSEKT